MKEIPVTLYSHEVLAILEGRQTQFRRPIKPQPFPNKPEGILRGAHIEGDFCWPHPDTKSVRTISNSISKPNGPDDWVKDHSKFKPGDRLWVKEGFVLGITAGTEYGGWPYESDEYSGPIPKEKPHMSTQTSPGGWWVSYRADEDDEGGWRPSSHMPRWASRITLEVTNVRVERLHSISHDDVEAEGVEMIDRPTGGDDYEIFYRNYSRDAAQEWPWFNEYHAQDSYRSLWISIHGQKSWDANPWVYVVEFKKYPQHEHPIDP